jgi:hypothetical protein
MNGSTNDGSTNDNMEAVLVAVPDMYPSLLNWALSIKGSKAFTKEILSADPRNKLSSAPADKRLLHISIVFMKHITTAQVCL